MNKTKITLPTGKWGTLRSKYKPESNYVSNDEFTVGSYNFLTNISGAITKRPTDIVYNAAALTNAGKDQFEAIFNNGTHHLLLMDGGTLKYTSGDGIIHTVSAGYTAIASMEYCMFQNRVYMDNGVDSPSVYDLTASYGGVSYTPPQTKTMGCAAPASAVTFAADSSGGAVADGGYYYKVTFLYYGFEESNGGTISALHTVTGGPKTVNLLTVPVGGYGVTARNIYRSTTVAPTDFRLVGTISDNTTVIFVDILSAGSTPIPTFNNLPPVFSYIGLNLSRLWVAGVSGTPSEIYWSNPGQPDIFDPDNSLQCNPGDPIQGIYVYQGITVVLNRHSIGQIVGTTDDSFQYQQVPGSVGCVDNRSIQIRTLDGVPTLMWLSDRGIYGFNGSSVFYMSDPIEDEVSLNIQQVNFVTGSRSVSTLADWQAGTSSPGIDLTTNPGQVTTIDPTEIFQSQADWESGTLDNIATLDGSNSLKVPTQFTPTLAQGTLGGSAYQDGVDLKLPTTPDFTGEIVGSGAAYVCSTIGTFNTPQIFMYPIIPPRGGILTALAISFKNDADNGATFSYRLKVYSDSFGSPANVLYTGPTLTGTYDISPITVTQSGISLSLTSGIKYWIGVEILAFPTAICAKILVKNVNMNGGMPKFYTPSGWSTSYGTPSKASPAADSQIESYIFALTAVPSFGSWTSPIYDSKCSSVETGMSITISGTYPTNCSGSITVYGSNDQLNWLTTQVVSNPNGLSSLTLSGNRYWKLITNLATSDDRVTPILGTPALKFNIVGTWISPVIETTLDGTSFISMPVVNSIPSGTTIVYTIATSVNSAGPWTGTGNADGQFGPLGSAVIRRYAKLKAVLTTTADNASTPSTSSLELNWNLSSTYVSSAIDIGQIPSGWGLFQATSTLDGGTLVFSMKSAASSGGLSAATYYTVSNGTFPNSLILPLQFTQVRMVFTSTPGNLPTVDSFTLNWFTGGNVAPIRVASIFVQKTYFLAAAEIRQPQNNVVIVYDQEGLWRLFRDVNVNSLSLFFNQPFYCDAVRKYIYQWLTPPTGASAAITMDVRTKAFDLDLLDNLKNVRSCRVVGINTGTTIHAYYSVDRGTTWIEMLNVNGTTGYVTTTDGNKFSSYFVPEYSTNSVVSGTTIMFRVTSTDAYPCEILTIEPTLYVRQGRYTGEPV
jgi:hypothetical protein